MSFASLLEIHGLWSDFQGTRWHTGEESNIASTDGARGECLLIIVDWYERNSRPALHQENFEAT